MTITPIATSKYQHFLRQKQPVIAAILLHNLGSRRARVTGCSWPCPVLGIETQALEHAQPGLLPTWPSPQPQFLHFLSLGCLICEAGKMPVSLRVSIKALDSF